MSSRIPVPDGCGAIEGEGLTLIAPEEELAELEQAGLHRLRSWSATAGTGHVGPGRGAVTRFELPSGRRLILKQLRRGGMAARFRNNRFRGSSRLLANLTLPVELARRGVITPEPACLLLQEGPPGKFQGWLATRELDNAMDAMTWLGHAGPTGPGLLDSVVRFVRTLHDAGLQHRDLNLGNLMVKQGEAVGEAVAVLDLDGARLHGGGLPFRLRLISLWRLERSMVKRFGGNGPLGTDYRRSWAAAYSAGDDALARRILRWWPAGRILLAVHRAGW
ncbi:MAG: hypothetical protein IFK94_14390 [Acidobacteria bacterium]|uniref:Protein kinase domain-containing protein n=1 Tax=Candidatus Polarisedimenticola svalbardensis TaxID=2886004 RepID=A0A8J6XYN9_9BACT|nr:hypothetical protein [Candidatus Polarisedimenticola svalbardensis]